jgi:hypothetical protein
VRQRGQREITGMLKLHRVDDVRPDSPYRRSKIAVAPQEPPPNPPENVFARGAAQSQRPGARFPNAGPGRAERKPSRMVDRYLTDLGVKLIQIGIGVALLDRKEMQVPAKAAQLPDPSRGMDAVMHRDEKNSHAALVHSQKRG